LATQGSSSNSRLVAVGAVVLLLGVILVLLILRGSVGGDDPAPEQPAATEEPEDGEEASSPEDSDLVGEGEGSTARVPLPLELEDGFEAVTVRVAYVRGVAALPQAGDRVVLYQLASEPDDEDEEDDDATGFSPPGDDAERVLDDVEVLGVIGPRPAANDGTLTFVVAVEEQDVPSILPIARDGEIWFTLLPGDDEAEEDGEDEAAEDEA
jgi:hypothetical protein